MILWPLFGTVNQLLASMALLVITIYLAKQRISIKFTVIPMSFMILMTGWAMILGLGNFYRDQNWLLFVIRVMVFALEIWMIIEAVLYFKKEVNI